MIIAGLAVNAWAMWIAQRTIQLSAEVVGNSCLAMLSCEPGVVSWVGTYTFDCTSLLEIDDVYLNECKEAVCNINRFTFKPLQYFSASL